MRRALQVILLIGVMGMSFSGVLTYREYATRAGGGCSALGTPGTVLGYPPCVYGLVMYTAVVVVAALGSRRGE